MKMLRSPRVWIGIAISVVCLWLAFREVPFTEFGRALARARFGWLAPAILVQFLAVASRAQRWAVLLPRKGLFWHTFWAHSIGFLFTNVLPLRMGEPARAIVLSSHTGIPVVQVAGTVLVERALDVAIVVLGLVGVLPFMNVPPLVTQAGLVFGILILVAFVALWLVVRYRSAGERILAAVLARLRFLPAAAIQARWGELVEGLAPLTRPSSALAVVFWTFIAWLCSTSIYYFSMLAFQPQATPLEAIFIVVALALAITVPSSPGFLGVFQYVGQQALVLPFAGKYDGTTALAITMTSYMIYYIFTTGLGVIGLWRMGESFSKLGQLVTTRAKKAEPESPG